MAGIAVGIVNNEYIVRNWWLNVLRSFKAWLFIFLNCGEVYTYLTTSLKKYLNSMLYTPLLYIVCMDLLYCTYVEVRVMDSSSQTFFPLLVVIYDDKMPLPDPWFNTLNHLQLHSDAKCVTKKSNIKMTDSVWSHAPAITLTHFFYSAFLLPVPFSFLLAFASMHVHATPDEPLLSDFTAFTCRQ